jgi:predicted 3-demethylubiquinone-9 3-methyltransferase (glyoxalase superfamily)
MLTAHKIIPCLWFDKNGEEAARFYTALFKNSRIVKTTHYGTEGKEIHGGEPGQVLTVLFELEGQRFTALNGGPHFKFNEAVSLQVMCETQEEIDRYWSALTEGGGRESNCGWLKDKFGLSWQIVPVMLPDLLSDPDPAKAARAMKAMLGMKKLDIARLRAAKDGSG